MTPTLQWGSCEWKLQGIWVCRDLLANEHFSTAKVGPEANYLILAKFWLSVLWRYIKTFYNLLTYQATRFNNPKARPAIRQHIESTGRLPPSQCGYLSDGPWVNFKLALIHDFLCSLKLYMLCETASTLEHGIWVTEICIPGLWSIKMALP